ncbi:MAG TPA: NHL repeat-containing protein [Dehalococcoidia bacterium]|nr:NHL repeat-containing protein [Dehalococcoidia bacterium]
MSSTDWGQPGSGLPGGDGTQSQRWPNWLKLLVLLILLLSLGWVILLTANYFRTGKDLGDLGIPAPVSNLFDKQKFQYVASIDNIATPMGVAVGKDGRIYVTDTGGERKIHIYDSLWQEAGSFAPPDTEASARIPVYLAIAPSGDVYVSDRGAAAIYIFTADGESKGQVTAPAGFEDWHPLGLTFDKDGNLYVADVTPEKHRVVVLDPAGNLKLTFGTQGEGEGQFWYPNGIAVDEQGRIFVADSNNGRMQAFDKDGKYLFKISRGMSSGDLSMPRGIAIDGQGRLLITDTSRGAVQAYQITDSGNDSVSSSPDAKAPVKFIGSFAGDAATGNFLLYPNGMALDGQGKIYVADRAHNRVQIWKY